MEGSLELDNSQEQENENDQEDEADPAATIVAQARTYAISSIPEPEDEYQQNDQQHVISSAGELTFYLSRQGSHGRFEKHLNSALHSLDAGR